MRVVRVALVALGTLLTIGLQGCDGSTEPSNAPPVAAFTARCSQLACTFENGSTDKDGSIAGYAWSFGDGGTSADASPTHRYAAPGGEFTVTVAVTDNDGAATTYSKHLAVSADSLPPGDLPPVAAFSVSCAGLACVFTDQSTDPDAGDSVVSWAWDFGDGHTSTTPSPSHSYAAPGGHFTVTLAVADRQGSAASVTHAVDLTSEPAPDISGTYERETPHSSAIHDSRYVIRADGTFDYIEDTDAGQRTIHGNWRFATSWGGWSIAPGVAVLFDFDGFVDSAGCGGEGFGIFLMDGHLALSYCGVMYFAGLEEGVYTDVPGAGIPDVPPPQAGQIAFSRDGKIYRANTDGTGLVQLSSGPGDGEPAWSADGSRIAFSRGGDGGGIYVMSADGANPVRRASSGGSPTWSPDGQTIAFSCRVNVDDGICTVRADEDGAGVDTLLVRRGQLTNPAWSPDGTHIAFSSDWNMFDFWFDIWTMSLDGSQLTALRNHTPETPNVLEQYLPAWSPNGQRLALLECPWAFNFCSSGAITVMNADGTGLMHVAVASGYAHPTWSPDGQTIAFANGSTIEWISSDGSQRGRIIENGTGPAWRP